MCKRKLAVVGLAVAILVAPAVLAEEAPTVLKDLSQLNLTVKSTEEVGGLQVPSMNMGERTLTPDAGHKLVVVTLEGSLEKAAAVTVEGSDFDAIFEAAGMGGQIEILKPTAIAMKPDYWKVTSHKGAHRDQTYLPAGPVTVRLAWMLPKKIETFSVRYPTLVAGEAHIAKAGESDAGSEDKSKGKN